MEVVKINDKYSVYSYLLDIQEYDIDINMVSDILYDPYIESLFVVTNNEVVKMLKFDYYDFVNYIREKKIEKCKLK
jgi:hypothetical protein